MTGPTARIWIAAAAFSLLLVAGLSPPQSTAAPSSLTFVGSGLVGGGFVNVIAADPADPAVLIAGGDVSGFHRSTDGGGHWLTSNTGLSLTSQLAVATIAFSIASPGTVYAGVGQRGAGGGLLVSTDDGVTWSILSATPQFSGSNNDGVTGIPHTQPRSTGTLLALDEAGDHLYAATFAQGVLRSDDGGHTWITLGLAGRHLRGLAFDPSDPDVLYVGAYNDGVYETKNASTTGTFTKIAGSPLTPEELALVGGSLYVAGGKAGVFRSRDQGATWQQLGGAAIPISGPAWMSIDGYRACGRDVVYAGANAGAASSIVRTTDDGATWSSVSAVPTRVHATIGGAGGETWWLAKQPRMMLGGGFYAAAQLAVGPGPAGGVDCLEDRVLVAGRAGVWSSSNAGIDWYPMVRGLGVTISRDVAADPALVGRTYVATADWVFHHSSDSLTTVTQKKPPGGTTAADIAIDGATTPGRTYVATGNPSSNSGGEVFSSANPPSSGWTDEGLSSVAGGKRPLAITVRTVGTQRILLVAVDNGGIWRKVGSTWTKVNATAMAKSQPSRGASIVWPAASSTIYLFDHETGIWRSNDSGRTWSKIWTVTSSYPGTGYLAADPASPGRLFVSIGGFDVYRIDGATSGSVDLGTLTPIEVGAFQDPGPIEFGPAGELYATEEAAPGVTPGLFRSEDLGTTWTLASDAFYRAAARFPFDLSIASDGHVFVSTNGDGVLVGTPA